MPIDPSFKAAINVLAELASDSHPAYVRVNAAGLLANILSPANSKHADILLHLNDHTEALPDYPSEPLLTSAQHPHATVLEDGEVTGEDDETSSAEEDDPL
ncbi:MAG: hypothetical protein F4Y69_02110 [Chloroflexi bacterium]|nr:hypothetical protein [Chloroflexota bacterium]MYF22252.1 hypothetical protein [Chloroflexota bacterium]